MSQPPKRSRSKILKAAVNRHAISGAVIGIVLVVLTTMITAWSQIGQVTWYAMAVAQMRSPILWLIDLFPVILTIWGQFIGSSISLRANAMMEGETRELREKTTKLVQQMEDEAVTGPDLGLPNRHAFENRVDEILSDFDDIAAGALVVRIQTDSFQAVHRTSGQDAAFDLVRQIASRLEHVVGDGILGYFGYDDFALYIPGHRDLDEAKRIGERIALLFDVPINLQDQAHSVRGAAGITRYPDDGETAAGLMHLAEMAQYAAEQDKREFCIYDAEHNSDAAEVSRLTAELAVSIDTETLFAVYQPAFSCGDGELQRLRLCPRWPHATRGTLDEDEVLALADRTSIIHGLSLWLLREGVARIANWRELIPSVQMQVRLPSRAFGLLPISQVAGKLLAAHDVPPDQLQLLVTETAILQGGDAARAELDAIRDAGIGLVLDDVGGRDSSVIAAAELPVNEVRLPIQLMRSSDTETKRDAIISSLVSLATQLSLPVTAPGIEDEDSQSLIRSIDCQFMEGDRLGVAIPVEEMGDWVQSRINTSDTTDAA